MLSIPLPTNVTINEGKDNEAEITIDPCYPGYGTTLGNALRRVMLSSIGGAAVTQLKIDGATHEFTTLPNVKEDILEFVLRVKTLRFSLHDTDKAVVKLSVKGEKAVTGKDIKTTSEVEVVNPEVKLLTITDEKAEVNIEFTVENGVGYVPVENRERDERVDASVILVDSVFTPIKNVNYSVEHVRVGQMTNYDKLVLSVRTDGSISPTEAFRKAVDILLQHFSFFQEGSGEKKTDTKEKKTTKKSEDEEEENKES